MKNNMNRQETLHYLIGCLDVINMLIATGKFDNEQLEKYRIMFNIQLENEKGEVK
jgi:hypothetical protein